MKKAVLVKELRAKDTKELFKDLSEAEKKIMRLKFSSKFRELKNYHEITVEKKKIARIWTVLTEKAIAKLNDNNQKVENAQPKK